MGSTAPAILRFRTIPAQSGLETSRSKNFNPQIKHMNKRDFIKKSGVGALGILLAPSLLKGGNAQTKLRTAHIGVGNMGMEDLKAISSHPQVEVTALCDVDAINLSVAHKMHPGARIFFDYRVMLDELADQIDAVIVSTPDHTHAPASLLAMEK